MNQINNPMTQLARLYQALESVLRRGAYSVPELTKHPEISAVAKNPWQVRDCLVTLRDRSHVITVDAAGAPTAHVAGKRAIYKWDVHSAPFILGRTQRIMKSTQPSKPAKHAHSREEDKQPQKAATPVYQLAAANNDELELNFHGTTLIVGRNPQTGRLRVTIEG